MITQDTINRFRWHAGLEGSLLEEQSISSILESKDITKSSLRGALTSIVPIFEVLNHELNGMSPSGTIMITDVPPEIPRELAYAIAEIVRMLRDCEHEAVSDAEKNELGLMAWRVETAWLAVLAGDIDDISEHLQEEERGRS